MFEQKQSNFHRKIDQKSSKSQVCAQTSPKTHPHAPWGRSRTSRERPRASQEPLTGVLGGPWGRPRTSRERPGALLKRPRSVPGAPPIAPNRPQGAQERFCIDFSSIWGRFWGRFSMVFALNSCSLGRSFVFSFDRVRVLRLLSTFASRAF